MSPRTARSVSRRLLRFAVAAGLAVASFAPAASARADDPAPPKPAAPEAAKSESSGPVFGYDPDRGAFIRSGDGAWELNPYAMVQLQNVSVIQPNDKSSTTFSLRAAKFIFHGHIFDPTLTYHFQVNAGDGKVAAEDIYLRWDPWRSLGLLVGQIEVPFNRQHITLEAYQQLIDRSIVDARFNLQRDIGAAVYGADPEHRFEATLGVWNGSRQNAPNDDQNYMTTLRLAYNPWGPIAFREADLDDSRSPKLSIAVAGALNPTRTVTDPTGASPPSYLKNILQGVGELTLRYRGLSLTGEAHARQLEKDGKQKVDYGAFGQIGMFVLPKKLELIGRVSAIGGDVSATDTIREVTAGASYYFRKHRFKAQVDYSHLQTQQKDESDRVRLQIEFFL